MAGGYRTLSWLQRRGQKYEGVTSYGAATTYTDPFRISAKGSRSLRIDFVTGSCTDADASNSISLEDSAEPSLGWNTLVGATATLADTMATEKPVTSVATNTITSAAHGFSNGDAVGVSAASETNLPGGVVSTRIYYVINKTTSTFQLTTVRGDKGHIITITSAGTTAVIAPVTITSLRISADDVTEDESLDDLLPLRPNGRIKVVTAAADVLQLLDVLIMQED